MLSNTTKAVLEPIATGEYTATFSSMRDGKTASDTMLTFTLDNGRKVNAFVNNSRVIYTDADGVGYTSEDFFFIGLKRQLKMYNDDVSPMEVLHEASQTPVTLWIIADEQYTNVYTSKPKQYDSADLGL